MTRLLAIMVAAAVALAVTTTESTAYANDGQVSEAQLAELGLGSMQTVSDEEGQQIRGKFLDFTYIKHNMSFQIGAVFAKNIVIVNGPVVIRNNYGRRRR